MAVLFSAVKLTAGDKETEFLVRGIPRELGDIESYTAFKNFVDELNEETTIKAHAEAYLYGEGEIYTATIEEVAYFMKRIEYRPDFLPARCNKTESADFAFQWTPEELFNKMEDLT